MAEVEGGQFPSFSNVMSRLDPDGSMAQITNVLSNKKPLLDDIPWQEGNLTTGHQITQTVNALPSASWRRINEGIVATKGQTAQYQEACGLLEDESRIDEALLELNGGQAWRMTEDAIKMEGIAQQLATAVFYESASTNPERIHGLAPRYPATSGYSSSSYVQVGTNAGVNSRSIWIITWAPRKAYGIFPKGTMGGLQREDHGKERIVTNTTTGASLYAWVTRLKWRVGIAVEDYRHLVRLQWDPDDAEMAVDEKGLYMLIQDGLNTIHEVSPQTRIYMDRTTKRRLDRQVLANEGRPLATMQVGDHRLSEFGGVPIRIEDSLVAETAIS